MKEKVIKIAKNPLILGSAIILLGSFAANIGNYIFNLIMGRLLTAQEYGLMVSLISVTALFAVFQGSLSGIFAKFAARFYAKEDTLGLSDLIKKGMYITLIVSITIVATLLIFINSFSNFLHVGNLLIVFLTIIYIFISIIQALPNGILQGQLKVYLISLINILVAILKLGIGLTLVILGFKVVGAMVGIVSAAALVFILAMYFIKKDLKKENNQKINETKILFNEIRDYGTKFFAATLGITIFTTIDVILARHFFSPLLAGQYAALSIMGKSIFYLTFPINFIFFPLIAQKKEKKEKVLETLLLAALITVLFSVFGSFLYFQFPSIILKIFFPNPSYKILATYLGPFSLYILVFSVASLLNSYLLSIGKTQIFIINILSGIVLTVLIILFHSGLFQMIGSLFVGSCLLLTLLLIYYWNNGRD